MMRLIHAGLLCALLCLFSLTYVQADSQQTLRNAFMIEFKYAPTQRHLMRRRHHLYRRLENEKLNHIVRHEFKYINAISIEVDKPSEALNYLKTLHDVKRIWPVSLISKPAMEIQHGGDTGTLTAANNMTGVIRVQKELGLTGKGMKVGVIDTGVDYTHPALGGCFGPSCRVAYGHDFVGDMYDGTNSFAEDSDPMDNCNGHGIIGAHDPESGFVGVAPDVTFGAYRIFGCTGSTADDIIMKAMEMAFDDGMDVINLSLGDQGWADSPTAVLGNALADKGMAVAAAAGNAGDKGAFQVGAPAVGHHVVSVASVDNAKVLQFAIIVNGKEFSYVTETGHPINAKTAEIVATSSEPNKSADGCSAIEADLTGKFALISRGGCFFDDKALNAQAAGAIGVLIYNNEIGILTPAAHNVKLKIPVVGLSKEDGLAILKMLSNPEKATVETPQEHRSFDVPTAGLISTFSSWGLSADLDIKPEVSAPGGQIFSTFPTKMGSYATLSGTSMACPHIAGVMTLIRQARGGGRSLDALTLRTLMMNNAQPFKVFQKDYFDSVARQGAGLVDIHQAINSKVIVQPQSIPIGDTKHLAANNEYKLTVENIGQEATEFKLTHLSAASVQAYGPSSFSNSLVPLTKPEYTSDQGSAATVEFAGSTVNVPAGGKVEVLVRIHPPANSGSIPPTIYSGFLVIHDQRTNYDVHVPYAGLTASLHDMGVLLQNSTLPMVELPTKNVISSTSPGLVVFQLSSASAMVVIDVVSAAEKSKTLGTIPGGYDTYLGRNDIMDSHDILGLEWHGNVAESFEAATSRNKLLPTLYSTGILRSSFNHNLRVASNSTVHGQAMTGVKALPTGKYHIRVSALKMFGNPAVSEDFDTWMSPELDVQN
ncbi:peptidase S8/S53 domain-containing protein [Umbelopsis sp. AD052]|nr:peptidase S8/S53 domain-containing protein [Umbelopsis sp. AD052]